MKVYSKFTESDVPEGMIKIFVHHKGTWKTFGYKCPECGVLYKSLRIELMRHFDVCKGKPIRRNLED